MSGRVFLEGEAAEPPRFLRYAGIVKIDRNGAPRLLRFWKIDEDSIEFPVKLQRSFSEENLVDVQRGDEIELYPRVVLQHLEANGVLSADELLLRLDADVEMVIEEVVVGAIAPIFPA